MVDRVCFGSAVVNEIQVDHWRLIASLISGSLDTLGISRDLLFLISSTWISMH